MDFANSKHERRISMQNVNALLVDRSCTGTYILFNL